jgi:hypothetical protein
LSVFDGGKYWDLQVTLVTTLDSVGASCAATLALALNAAELALLGLTSVTSWAGITRNRIVGKKSLRKSWTKFIGTLASEQPVLE